MRINFYAALNNLSIGSTRLLIATCFFVTIASSVAAQSQGPNNGLNVKEESATCLPCPGAIWTNQPGALISDSVYASTSLLPFSHCIATSCFTSRGLITANYNFSIPLNATITGIVVKIERKADSLSSIKDSIVSLQLNDTAIGANTANPIKWDTTDHYITYGNFNYLWGVQWTPALIDSIHFGVFFKPANYSVATVTAFVDDISIIVFYSLPSNNPVAAFSVQDTLVCPNDTIRFFDLSTNNPTQWLWQFPGGNPATSSAQNPAVLYTTPGFYSVTLTVSDTAGADTLVKTNYIEVLAPPNLQLTGDTTVCDGQQAQLEVSGGIGYQWSPCATLNTCQGAVVLAQPSSTTQYSVTATGNYQCTASGTLTVTVNPLPPQPVITVNGTVLTSSAASGNQWYRDNAAINGDTGSEYTATISGFYTVQVTDANGCSSISGAVQVNVSGITGTAGPDAKLEVYPNPVTGVLQIKTDNINPTGCWVYTINGEKIYESLKYDYISTAGFSPGLYFLEIKSAEGVYRTRFVKE